ncbi:MAG: hypothetical protein IKK57_10250 [Clostridia bacterium]|nr:hypothetical protein [Clostridia bacterium]
MAHKPLLNEPASPRTQLTILLGLGAGAAALLFLAIRETGGLLRTMYIVFAGVAVLLAAAAVLIGRRYRCVMDEYGVQLGHARLTWADIRTAAVIRRGVLPAFLSRFPDEQHFILLSVRRRPRWTSIISGWKPPSRASNCVFP